MFYPNAPFGVNPYNNPYRCPGYVNRPPGAQLPYGPQQPANQQDTMAYSSGNLGYPVYSNAACANGTGNSSFACQHPDAANEFAHACRHMLMDRAEALQDMLPTATQAGRVWLQDMQNRLLLKQQQEADARNTCPPSAGVGAARTVATDLAREAPRFLI